MPNELQVFVFVFLYLSLAICNLCEGVKNMNMRITIGVERHTFMWWYTPPSMDLIFNLQKKTSSIHVS